MYYPRNLFSANETLTRRNLREHEKKVNYWYQVAETIFPDYFKRSLRERHFECKPLIDAAVGYSI